MQRGSRKRLDGERDQTAGAEGVIERSLQEEVDPAQSVSTGSSQRKTLPIGQLITDNLVGPQCTLLSEDGAYRRADLLAQNQGKLASSTPHELILVS
ncbi:unnamed protein product [Boreogadus saida]